MMRSLFLLIEQSLGPSLAPVSALVYWVAIVLLAHRILAPLLRLRMEMASARLRMEERMVMECPHCHRETVVADSQCAFCRQSLPTPWDLKVWHFLRLWHQPKWFRWTSWSWDIIGLLIFIVLTAAGFIGLRAWTWNGPLQQLFLGVAIFCWVAIGWLVARVLHIGRGGPIARLRDLVFSFAAAGILAVSVFLAVESTAVTETVMWRIPIGEGGIAKIEDRALLLPQGMISFEYLQVDHDLVGYHRVIPIAFLGNERLEVKHGRMEKWFLDNLWKHLHGYSERGLSVRSRTEQFLVVPNQEYEVVEREKQVYFRPAVASQ
ncbi:MAG TPA: hypothetical protein VN664_08240 [Burkholderiales bacterium]|jgi:hypothetical protein|nr:hypothetical protein [Burkholderiales bacterium]